MSCKTSCKSSRRILRIEKRHIALHGAGEAWLKSLYPCPLSFFVWARALHLLRFLLRLSSLHLTFSISFVVVVVVFILHSSSSFSFYRRCCLLVYRSSLCLFLFLFSRCLKNVPYFFPSFLSFPALLLAGWLDCSFSFQKFIY